MTTDLLHNRYRIERELGWGGFATTYLATDLDTQQTCVVKELSIRKVRDWKSVELFEREAKILKNLNHSRIPAYFDHFTIETERDYNFYLVEAYVEGKTLAEWVESGRHFTEAEVIEIAWRITETLEYLHGFSPPIIHRDLKPTNIILNAAGEVFLIDFGAVRDTLTIAGGSTMVGTFGYMPPEQLDGLAVPASDLYALGTLLIYLLSHKEPSKMEKRRLQLYFQPHVRVSPALEQVLLHLIEPDWRSRYASATDLKRDLHRLQQNELPQVMTTAALDTERYAQRKWLVFGSVMAASGVAWVVLLATLLPQLPFYITYAPILGVIGLLMLFIVLIIGGSS